jgi:hypothetical protein
MTVRRKTYCCRAGGAADTHLKEAAFLYFPRKGGVDSAGASLQPRDAGGQIC